MSYLKTPEEIEQIKRGGKLIGEILEKLALMVKPGVRASELDEMAEKMIREVGGVPSFKGYKGRKNSRPFPGTICLSINEDLVHGVASREKIVRQGDIVSIDIGMSWLSPNHKFKIINHKSAAKVGGYYTDTALTVAVGEVPEKTKELLRVTKEALEVGINAARAGNTVADIGKAIEEFVKSHGNYGIVRDLVGHGVGHAVHEEPRVPNYYDKELEKWKLEPGVVIAIEPMITMGDYRIKTADDGWSISTADGSLCAHFEHTVVVTESDPVVLTRRSSG